MLYSVCGSEGRPYDSPSAPILPTANLFKKLFKEYVKSKDILRLVNRRLVNVFFSIDIAEVLGVMI